MRQQTINQKQQTINPRANLGTHKVWTKAKKYRRNQKHGNCYRHKVWTKAKKYRRNQKHGNCYRVRKELVMRQTETNHAAQKAGLNLGINRQNRHLFPAHRQRSEQSLNDRNGKIVRLVVVKKCSMNDFKENTNKQENSGNMGEPEVFKGRNVSFHRANPKDEVDGGKKRPTDSKHPSPPGNKDSKPTHQPKCESQRKN